MMEGPIVGAGKKLINRLFFPFTRNEENHHFNNFNRKPFFVFFFGFLSQAVADYNSKYSCKKRGGMDLKDSHNSKLWPKYFFMDARPSQCCLFPETSSYSP